MTAAAARKQVRRRRAQFTPRAALLAIVVTALLVYLFVPVRAYVAQRDKLNQLEHQTQILEQQKAKLEGRVRMLNDPAYLERIARECLGMVKKGEIGFVVVPEGPRTRLEPPVC
jgi:cell division protein FtsB